MGKVRNSVIKNLSKKIVEDYSDYLSTDFEKNQKFLDLIVDLKSKHYRNRVAGYITRLKIVEQQDIEYGE
ncbi:MAG: 30S ribosomal protein S17e [Candidatus Hodarchaeales archaeon]|jgi:small subunit ribosomal protein S17e